MKKLLFLLSIMWVGFSATAQPWTELLPEEKAESELTLKDYQDAFNEYWEPYNLDRGYYTDKNGERKKARGWKQFKRWEYYWETQVDAQGRFPQNTAYQVFEQYMKNQPKNNTKDDGDWINLGTNSSEGGYAGIGRINCIEYHPTNSDVFWVGTPSGGLWATADGGKNWEVLTDENSVLGVSDIIIPSDYDVSKTIYIATGDRDAEDNRSIGVLKSTDAGQTWMQTGLAFTVQQNAMTNRLLKDPENDQVIIAATTKGVFKTTNGGETWDESISAFVFIDMEFKPGDFSTLYGSTKSGSIYVSSDGGENWTRSMQAGKRTELAVTKADPNIVYAVIAGTDNGLYGVYKSISSGESFNKVYDGNTKNLLGWASSGGDEGGQGWYDLAIAASPNDADVLLVGGVNTWRSNDGGTTFFIVNHWYGDRVQAVHADKHMLSYRDNGDLFECNDGGVYISTNDGSTWTDLTNGIVNSQIYKLGVSQQLSNEVIMGLQDNGTKQYSIGKWWDVLGGDGMECLIDYADYKTQYGSLYYGELVRTTNWWVTSNDVTPSQAGAGAWVTPYIIDPSNHSTLYAGYSDIWKTTNKGTSWSKISSINVSGKFRSMAIAPSNNKVLYAASLSSIYKTTDGGSNWVNISSGLPVNAITSIAVDYNDPNTVWVTAGGYDIYTVFQSTNGGEKWDNISKGLPSIPAHSIVQDVNFKSVNSLYVGTEAGVFHKNGDDDWKLFNNGLPNVKIGELEIYYDEDLTKCRLRAATYGRGLWETPMVFPNVVEFDTLLVEKVTENAADISVYIIDGGEQVLESGFILSKNSGAEFEDKYITYKKTNPLVTDGKYSLTFDNLDNGTYYFVKAYIRSEYGYAYSNEIGFATLCGGANSNLPVIQEFAVDSLPACWSNYDNLETSMMWGFDNPGGVNFNSTTNENGFAIMDASIFDNTDPKDADLVTPEYDFTDHNNVNFIFEHNAVLNNGAKAEVHYSIDNGVNWTIMDEWADTVGMNGDANYYVKNLSDIVGGKPGIVFKWNFRGTESSYWAIDDVLIDSLPAVHFKVKDVKNNPIENALVTFNSTEVVTGFTGEAIYRSVSNTVEFNYSVAAEGYIVDEGNVTLNYDNALLDIVLNKIPSTNAALSDLLLDGETIEGFSPGITNYEIMLPWDATEVPVISAVTADENATLTITQPTIESRLGSVNVVAEDGTTDKLYRIAFKFESKPTYSVIFNVMNSDSEPIAYATVKLLDMVRSTNEQGVAEFAEVDAVGDTIFEITNNDYYDYVGDISIVDKNLSVDVVMTGVGISNEDKMLVSLYPNPATDKLYLNISSENLPAEFSLTDVSGKVVLSRNILNENQYIALDELLKGIYLVNIKSNNKSYTEKIVIE